MLMPNKIIKPVDSLFSISAFILKILHEQKLTIDEIHEGLNSIYYKKVSLEKVLLSLNFLYQIGKVELNNEIITVKI